MHHIHTHKKRCQSNTGLSRAILPGCITKYKSEVVVLFAVGTSLLRLSTIASYSLRKTPGGLEFQGTRDIRAIRRYCCNLILRATQLSMTVTDGM